MALTRIEIVILSIHFYPEVEEWVVGCQDDGCWYHRMRVRSVLRKATRIKIICFPSFLPGLPFPLQKRHLLRLAGELFNNYGSKLGLRMETLQRRLDSFVDKNPDLASYVSESARACSC